MNRGRTKPRPEGEAEGLHGSRSRLSAKGSRCAGQEGVYDNGVLYMDIAPEDVYVHFYYVEELRMETRIGFIGIVVENRERVQEVNHILSAYGNMIRGRIGIPDFESGKAVIGLIVDGTNDCIGAMTGKLGNIPGITVKSAMTKKGE